MAPRLLPLTGAFWVIDLQEIASRATPEVHVDSPPRLWQRELHFDDIRYAAGVLPRLAEVHGVRTSTWCAPLWRHLHLAPDEFYVWGLHTKEEYRGRGLATWLVSQVGHQVRDEGRRWLWAGIWDSNLASQRTFRRLGAQPILRFRRWGFGIVQTWPVYRADPALVRRARSLLRRP